LLCDEPTSALDPELAGEVVDVLAQLAQEGMTMLIATHDLRLAANIANNVVFLDDGKVIESGSARDIFMRPSQPRTVNFVASLSDVLPDWEV
jgi:cystine transport system ATP-binding protein